MKFKARNGYTMVWVKSIGKTILFRNGIAEVDEKVGNELLKLGYERVDIEPKKVVTPKQNNKVEAVVENTTAQPKLKFKA